MTSLHPIAVHFAVALFATSIIFEFIGFVTRSIAFKKAAWINMIFAGAAILAAVLTGFSAEDSVIQTNEVHELMEIHETLGVIIAGIAAIMLTWRVFNQRPLSRTQTGMYLVIGFICLGLIIATGYYGGKMVYEHGVGVKPVMKQIIEERESKQLKPD